MRKLILGVSLYWPLILMLVSFPIIFALLGRNSTWIGVALFVSFGVFGLLFERVWGPYFKRTRFGRVMEHDRVAHSSSAK